MISTVLGNILPLYTQPPMLENFPDEFAFLQDGSGITAEEFAHVVEQYGIPAEEFAFLALHYGISQAELLNWLESTDIDPSSLDPQVADDLKDLKKKKDWRNSIMEQITGSTLFPLPSSLAKFLSQTAKTVNSAFDVIEEAGKQVAANNKEMLGQFEKTNAVADAVLPITMAGDIYDFVKLVGKIQGNLEDGEKLEFTWNCVKASSTMSKIVSKALQWPDAVAKMTGQFFPDLTGSIKSSKAICGLNIAAQGFSLIAGALSVAKQWAEAKKAIDYGEATLGTLGLVGNVLDMPATIVKKLASISPAIETAAKVGTWAPWLGVASTVLSAASIAAAGCSMGKSLKFSNRLERLKQEAAIKLLSRSKGHNLRKGLVKEQFKEAVKFVEYREAIILLKKMIADLGGARDEKSINTAYDALAKNISLLKNSGACGKNIAILMKRQNFLQNSNLFLSNDSFRTSLKEVLASELKRVRKLKDDCDFTALMRDIQVEIDHLSAPLLHDLKKVANEAYLDKLIATDSKTLMYHFNVSKEELSSSSDEDKGGLLKSLETISRISKSSMAVGIAEGVDDIVKCLQGRTKQKIAGDIWNLAMSIVSLVATIILTLVAFGISCTPLAPIAYAVLAAVALASVIKIIYDYLQKNEFKKRFGAIEERIMTIRHQEIEEELEKSHSKQVEAQLPLVSYDEFPFSSHVKDLAAVGG